MKQIAVCENLKIENLSGITTKKSVVLSIDKSGKVWWVEKGKKSLFRGDDGFSPINELEAIEKVKTWFESGWILR
jgi:hypothetical protein